MIKRKNIESKWLNCNNAIITIRLSLYFLYFMLDKFNNSFATERIAQVLFMAVIVVEKQDNSGQK